MRRAVPLIVALAALVLPACSGDDAPVPDAAAFCQYAKEQRSMIVAPPLGDEEQLAATIEFYRLMGELAPAAIAEEWNDLVVNLETAAAIEPGNPESEQLVAMTAYATERSAYAVVTWLERNCDVKIPITTIAPQAPVPAITTTTDANTP